MFEVLPVINVRSARASTLALVGVSAIVLAIIVVFVLLYIHAGQGVDKQRSAIDSAALTAASDIGRITYNSPECGFVSLTGAAPTSKSTEASDGWIDSVHSINELLATSMLEYIVASNIYGAGKADSFMQQLAQADEKSALNARDELMQVITASMNGGTAYDAAGNSINVYNDAQNMYKANQDVKSQYAGTMTVELGCVQGGVVTPILIPADAANSCSPTPSASLTGLSSSSSTSNYYMSDTLQKYGSFSCYLGSVGSQSAVIDKGKFCPIKINGTQASFSGSGGGIAGTAGSNSTYDATNLGEPQTTLSNGASNVTVDLLVPTAVRVTANSTFDVQGKAFTNQFVACAVPGGNFRNPSYAQMTISFPDGALPEVTSLQSCYNKSASNQMASSGCVCDVYTASGGDFGYDPSQSGASLSQTYPWGQWGQSVFAAGSGVETWSTSLNSYVFSLGNAAIQPTGAQMADICVLNWLRTEGTLADLDTFLSIQKASISNSSMGEWNTYLSYSGAGSSSTYIDIVPPGPNNSAASPPNTNGVPAGFQAVYSFNASNGQAQMTTQPITPVPFYPVDENQCFAESVGTIANQGFSSAVSPAQWAYMPSVSTANANMPTNFGPGDVFHHNLPPPTQVAVNNPTFQQTQYIDIYYRDQVLQPGNGTATEPGSYGAVVQPGSYTSPFTTPSGGQHAGQPIWPAETATALPPATTVVAVQKNNSLCLSTCACCTSYGVGKQMNNQNKGTCTCGNTTTTPCACAACSCDQQSQVGQTNGGMPPAATYQDDFGAAYSGDTIGTSLPSNPWVTYASGSSGGGTTRLTYSGTNAVACDITFRRELYATKYYFNVGYVGWMIPK